MTVAYFGIYNREHPRNNIFLKCLKMAGIEVVEINHRGHGFRKYSLLAKDLKKYRGRLDAVIVGFPGPQAVILAKLFFRGPVISNVLLSLYDAVVSDRGRYSRLDPRAWYLWLMDFLGAYMADHIVLDCQAYIDYFVKNFRVRKNKFTRIFLGADENMFRPVNTDEKKFEIHYHSSFIPTHGTDTIVKAAKFLQSEGIKFVFSGSGQTKERDMALARKLKVQNIRFIDRFKAASELNDFINSSWISLGIFGKRPRTDRIIASKVFEALACGKPVITSTTAAGRELLRDKESVLFVRPQDPEDLAEKIRILKNDEPLRQKIAAGGRQAYEQNASFKMISGQLKTLLENVIIKS